MADRAILYSSVPNSWAGIIYISQETALCTLTSAANPTAAWKECFELSDVSKSPNYPFSNT